MGDFITKGFGFVFILFLLAGWGGGEAFAATYDVDIKASGPAGAFNPKTVTINSGDTVRWTSLGDNQEAASDQHPSHTEYLDPACPDAGCFDSPLLATNDTYSFTFLLAGTWEYHNHQLPGRTGTVIVNDLNAPGVVSDLAASNAASGAVDLSWTSPGDDVGSTGNFFTPTTYDIRYSTSTITEGNWASATVTDEPIPSVAGSSESITACGLSSSTTYYIAMKTSDEIPNESALSNVVSFTTLASSGDTTAPAAITDLAISGSTDTTATLTWTAPGDDASTGTAKCYDVRYSLSTITEGNWSSATAAAGEPTPSVAETSESMTVSGLDSGQTYFFAIKTSDEERNVSAISLVPSIETLPSSVSAELSIGTGYTHIPPAAIVNLAVFNATASSVDLLWTAPGNDGNDGQAASYDVRHAPVPIEKSNWSLANQVTGEPTPKIARSSESMTISGLSSDVLYYFAIKTSDHIPNESRLSNVESLKTKDIVAPGVIGDLTASNVTATSTDLTWSAPGDNEDSGTATAYDIRYSKASISETNWPSATQVIGEPTPAVVGSTEFMTVFGLSADMFYHYFAMKTTDEVANESILSNVVAVSTDTIAPAEITKLAFINPSPTAVELSWSAPGDDEHSGVAARYDIRYATEPLHEENWDLATAFVGIPPPQEAGFSESVTIVGLDHGTTYYIAIKTVDELANESGLSFVVTFTIPPALVLSLFEKDLSFGEKSDDVKKLQEFLNRDPELYPEGLVTGYFGGLTQRAVQRFQAKYDIVSYGDAVTTGFGRVGPKTRAKLNELQLIQLPVEPSIESTATSEVIIPDIQSQINALREQVKDLQRQLDTLLNR